MPPQGSEADLWYRAHLQPHEAMIRAWLQARFPNESECDDIVQEGVCRVLQARVKKEVRSPKAFLFATVRNLAVAKHRKSLREGEFVLADLDELGVFDESEDVSTAVARAEELELLTRAIQSLPDRCRQIITLRKIYGMSQAEIARELGISINTVDTQASIGMRKLFTFFTRLTHRDRR